MISHEESYQKWEEFIAYEKDKEFLGVAKGDDA